MEVKLSMSPSVILQVVVVVALSCFLFLAENCSNVAVAQSIGFDDMIIFRRFQRKIFSL